MNNQERKLLSNYKRKVAEYQSVKQTFDEHQGIISPIRAVVMPYYKYNDFIRFMLEYANVEHAYQYEFGLSRSSIVGYMAAVKIEDKLHTGYSIINFREFKNFDKMQGQLLAMKRALCLVQPGKVRAMIVDQDVHFKHYTQQYYEADNCNVFCYRSISNQMIDFLDRCDVYFRTGAYFNEESDK